MSFLYPIYNSTPTNLLCSLIIKYIAFPLFYRSNIIILPICLYNSCLNWLRKERSTNMHLYCLYKYVTIFRSVPWFCSDSNFHLDIFVVGERTSFIIFYKADIIATNSFSFHLWMDLFLMRGILLNVRFLVAFFFSFHHFDYVIPLPSDLYYFWWEIRSLSHWTPLIHDK